MLTISEIARFVGVTVRAVRHYHATGLLPEPARDASGYRRYDAQAVIDLIRIKTLADAGVPLSRVRELLHAEPEPFARAVEQIDHDLKQKIRELQLHRKRVGQLAAGDSLVLPPEVVDYLARLRALGMSERHIEIERDGWILVAAHYPDRVGTWAAQKRAALDDPEFRDLYLTFDRAFEWQPDDPRLHELARAILAYAGRMAPATDAADPDQTLSTVLSLFQSHVIKTSAALQGLSALLEEEVRPPA